MLDGARFTVCTYGLEPCVVSLVAEDGAEIVSGG